MDDFSVKIKTNEYKLIKKLLLLIVAILSDKEKLGYIEKDKYIEIKRLINKKSIKYF